MKKLMALCLSVLMVFSMCSFTVMAEGEVDFSVIANGQPQNFVVENLSLNNNTITSSNTDVIALDGIVTRPLFEDAVVTVGVGSSSYDVTVKSMMVNPANYTDLTVTDETTVENFAGFSENPDGSTVLKDGAAVFTLTGNSNNLQYHFDETTAQSADRAVEFKVVGMNNNVNSTDMIDIRPLIYYYSADGTKLGEVSGSTLFRAAKSNTFSDYSNTGLGAMSNGIFKIKVENSELYTANNAGNWVKVVSNNNYWELSKFEGATKAVLHGVTIRGGSGSATGEVTIDDVVSYEFADASEVLSGASPQQKFNYFSKYLEEDYIDGDGTLTFATGALNFTADVDLAAYGAALAWETDTTAVKADGTLIADLTEAKTTSVTGTLTVENPDGEALEKSVTYDVTIAPSTVSATSEFVDFDSYGLADGGSIIGVEAGWARNDSNTYTVTNYLDGENNTLRIQGDAATSWNMNAVSYTFQSALSLTGARFLVMKGKVKMPTLPSTNNSVRFGLLVNDVDAGVFIARGSKLYGSKLQSGNSWHTEGTVVSASDKKDLPSESWIDFMLRIDSQEGTVTYYQDGAITNTTTYGDTNLEPDFSSITSMKFAFTTREATVDAYFDNLMLYTEKTKDGAIAAFTDAQKVEYFKNIVENAEISSNTVGVDENLDLTSSYSEYDLTTCGVAISWTSSNTAVVSNEGVITPAAAATPTDVVMTATISSGSEKAEVSFPIQVAQAETVGFTVTALEQSFDDASSRPTVTNATYADVDGRGSVFKITNESGSQLNANIEKYPGYSAGNTFADRFYISADVKYTRNTGGNYAIFGFLGNQGSYGGEAHIDFVRNTIELTTTTVTADASGTGIKYGNDTVLFPLPESVKQGEWMNITIDYNALSQTYQVYINGTLINDVPLLRTNTHITTGNVPFRGVTLGLSAQGEMMVDNLTVRKSSNTAKNEVNAALNAALLDYAAEWYRPILTNRSLRANTIGASFALDGGYDIDDSDKYNNPALYKYTTDGPAITYAVDNKAVTEISVTKPTVAEFTITSSKDDVTESKTVTRKFAPAAIRDLGASDAALNGVWLDGAQGTEKVVVASYNESNKLMGLKLFDLSDTENVAFDAETGILSGISEVPIPNTVENITHVKVMVIDANGITPLTFANTELTG